MAHQIKFTNPFVRPVQLQIASGNMQCDQNVVRVDQQLAGGASYDFGTDDIVVCWRRTADPDNPAGFNGWNQFAPDDDNTPVNIQL